MFIFFGPAFLVLLFFFCFFFLRWFSQRIFSLFPFDQTSNETSLEACSLSSLEDLLSIMAERVQPTYSGSDLKKNSRRTETAAEHIRSQPATSKSIFSEKTDVVLKRRPPLSLRNFDMFDGRRFSDYGKEKPPPTLTPPATPSQSPVPFSCSSSFDDSERKYSDLKPVPLPKRGERDLRLYFGVNSSPPPGKLFSFSFFPLLCE